MAPKLKRGGSKEKVNRRRSSSSRGLEDSFSASAESSVTLPPLDATGPRGSMSASGSMGSLKSSAANPKAKNRRARSRKKKAVEADEEEEEKPYTGPPPDEELFHEVLQRSKPLVAGRGKEDNVDCTYQIIREGETGIGQKVNSRNIHGFTPLAVAAAAGDAQLVSLLLERKADVTLASTERSELPLHHAATYARTIVCQLLVGPAREKGVIDAKTCTGWTALQCCAESGDQSIFKLLLSAKADPEIRNPFQGNEHSLHIAARSGNIDVAEILMAGGADVNATDSLSRTPLHMAAASCHADGVSLLLRSRADPHHRGGPSNLTPIDFVPAVHSDMEERGTVLRLLSSYSRAPPSPFRVDTRFDLTDAHDLI